uniref:Methylenetetrahydrofolate reductase n=1 Tax=Muribaculaceae bacterium Z82 TaxID=2304548 RepID=A0A7C9P572_9BACT
MNTPASILKPAAIPFSIEIFPPKGQLTLDAAREMVAGMAQAHPDFISVTCSAGGSGNGSQTVEVASLIQNEVGIPSVAHLTCVNSSRETVETAIAAMKAAGITTVLALRGDPIKKPAAGTPSANASGTDSKSTAGTSASHTGATNAAAGGTTEAAAHEIGASNDAPGTGTVAGALGNASNSTVGAPEFVHATDLIPLLKDAGFCVGAAAYPEGHIDCLDLQADIEHLKRKQDAGADFFITQLFFDNDDFYRFRERARAAGITRPITCGVMPFLGKSQIERMVFLCGSSLPSPIIKLLARYEDDPVALRQAGIDYACKQLVDLGRNRVDGVHVYSMNHPDIALAAAQALAEAGLRD